MKIYSWNVNGIRSIFEKGFLDWMEKESPEILCVQEIKSDEDSLDNTHKKIDGYYFYSNSALKKGYSGVGVYTKIKPLKLEYKIGFERFDNEGRLLKLFFEEFVIYNLYIPNGSKDKKDIPYKIECMNRIIEDVKKVSNKKVILLGDFNIAHQDLDIANHDYNSGKTTFTIEERCKIDELLDSGFLDSFRFFNKDRICYTCWSYAANQRLMDIGYRYDYVFVSNTLIKKVLDIYIEKNILGSDHCPVGIKIESKMKVDNVVYPKDTLF